MIYNPKIEGLFDIRGDAEFLPENLNKGGKQILFV